MTGFRKHCIELVETLNTLFRLEAICDFKLQLFDSNCELLRSL